MESQIDKGRLPGKASSISLSFGWASCGATFKLVLGLAESVSVYLDTYLL